MSVFNFDMMKNMQSEKFELYSINYFKTNFIMESNLFTTSKGNYSVYDNSQQLAAIAQIPYQRCHKNR